MIRPTLRKLLALFLCVTSALSPVEVVAADLMPLTGAILAGDYKAVESALRAGASPNAVDPAINHNSVYMAVAPGGPRDSDILALLAKSGAQLDRVDPQSKLTPLMASMVVTEKGLFSVLEGAKANQLVGLLLQHGANPNQALDKGETPLMVAVGLGNLTMVKTLLGAGADVRARDAQGTTALHIAYGTGQGQALIDALLAAGADPMAKDNQGRLPNPSATATSNSAPTSTTTAPPAAPAPEKSSWNKWLIGGAVVAAAVIGAVALSKYTDEQKRRKAEEAAAALANAQPPQPVKPLPPTPIAPPPATPPTVVREIVIEKLAPLTAQPIAGTEFVLHATLLNKTDVDLIYNGTLTGPNGLKFFGPRVVVIRKGARETMDVPVTLPTAGLQDLALQLDPVNEPNAKPQSQRVSVNVAPKAVTPPPPPPPAPVVSIAVAPTSMNEDASGVLTFTVSLNTPTSVNTVVTYSLGGTATNGVDYSTTGTGTVTILAGQTSATFAIDPTPDNVVESNETVIATVTNVTGGATISGSNGAATATIINDDTPTPSLTINDVTVNEAAGTATFTVTLSATFGQTVTVGYNTSNATATAGSDYTATSGTLTFPPGVTVQAISVNIVNESPRVFEGAETFHVNLVAPTNASIAKNLGVGTIRDDGTGAGGSDNDTPTLSVSSPTVAENAGFAQFTVSLSNASSNATTLNLSLANGSATGAGTDYGSVTSNNLQVSTDGGTTWSNASTATIAAGSSSILVRTPITNDSLNEANETFTLTATRTAGTTTNASATGTATIIDDDAAPVIKEIVLERMVTIPEQPTASNEFLLRATLLNKTDADITNIWTLTGPNSLVLGPQTIVTKAGTTGTLDVKLTLPAPGTQLLTLQLVPVNQSGARTLKQEISVNVAAKSSADTTILPNQDCPKPAAPPLRTREGYEHVVGLYEERETTKTGYSIFTRIVYPADSARAEILQEIRAPGGILESKINGIALVEATNDPFSEKNANNNLVRPTEPLNAFSCVLGDDKNFGCNMANLFIGSQFQGRLHINSITVSGTRNSPILCFKIGPEISGCARPKFRASSFDGEYRGTSNNNGVTYFHQATVSDGHFRGVTCTVSNENRPNGIFSEWSGSLNQLGTGYDYFARAQILQPVKRNAGMKIFGSLPEGTGNGKLRVEIYDALGKSFSAEIMKTAK